MAEISNMLHGEAGVHFHLLSLMLTVQFMKTDAELKGVSIRLPSIGKVN